MNIKRLLSKRESRTFHSRKFFFFSTKSFSAILGLPFPDELLEEAVRSGNLRSPFVVDIDGQLWHYGQAREFVEVFRGDLSEQEFANSMGMVADLEKRFPPHAQG
jgi:hypothetical protein